MDRWHNIDRVVVVGLGITGLSVVKHLLKYLTTSQIKVMDTRSQPPGADSLPDGIELHTGSWNLEWLLKADLIVVNPGIALATSELQQAKQRGIKIVGDIELFAWAVNAPVVAITGSNGKSTVTDLTGVMARAAGLKVGVGGNIGIPALDLIEDDTDLYVLELSSFQLETTSNLALKAAAFLNLSEDHMDRYDGMEDYRQAKLRIFEHAETIIVNRDDKATYPDENSESNPALTQRLPVTKVTFGLDEHDFGLIDHEGKPYLAMAGKPLVATEQLNMVGQHNIANALVALALLHSVNISLPLIFEALKQYSGLTHRCQLVAQQDGIRWVNDSKATNVASTVAALSGLECQGTLYLLVGGDGKGADFSPLQEILKPLPVQLRCFGRDGDQFTSLHPSAKRFSTMEEAVESIVAELTPGDMVMLSPACASFDQFKNFMVRGEAFTDLALHYTSKSSKA